MCDSYITTCDFCEKPMPSHELRYAMQRRPSDSTEFVSVAAGCATCFPNQPTAAELEQYAESAQFAADGYLFLTY